MRSLLSIVFVGVGGLAIVACSGSGSDGPRGGGGTGGVMLDCSTLTNRPDDCDKACASDSECVASYCENNTKCVAHCTAEEGCGEDASCNVSGRCVPNMGTGGTGNTGGGNGCQSVQITPTRSIPNVMFLVDRSGSMLAAFGGGTRWGVAHDAIEAVMTGTQSETSMTETQSIVRFGLATYHWNDDEYILNNSPPDPECPIVGPAGSSVQTLVPVGFALDNADTILASYPATFPNDPTGDKNDTPTGESINKLVAWIENNPPPAGGPTIIVLATDGEPDSCMYPDSNQTLARQLSVQAAMDAYYDDPTDPDDLEIQTFVLSVGSQVGQDHLQDMANVGVGLEEDGSEGNAQFWVGTNPAALESAFREIISDSISCEVLMDRRFDDVDKACAEGDVQLDGTPLSCPSEWRVKPGFDNVIELVNNELVDDDACDTFKSGDARFTAVFPCGAIVVE
jgi:hypothetical protein